MAKQITLKNLNTLKINDATLKEQIEKLLTDALKHEVSIEYEDETIDIIDSNNEMELLYILCDPNIVVYSSKGRPLGAYPITMTYETIIKLAKEN